jgi:hypothetical protein
MSPPEWAKIGSSHFLPHRAGQPAGAIVPAFGRKRGGRKDRWFIRREQAWEQWYNSVMKRTVILERRGKLSELDRSFDLTFWQAQPAEVRFNAAWELVLHYARVKGLDVRQLRLQRSVETFQRQRR